MVHMKKKARLKVACSSTQILQKIHSSMKIRFLIDMLFISLFYNYTIIILFYSIFDISNHSSNIINLY